MEILAAYKSVLTQAPAVSTRIFIGRVDQSAVRPNILLKNPDGGADQTHDGISDLLDAHLQVICRADTDQGCAALASAVRARLVDWVGTVSSRGIAIQLTELDKESSDYDDTRQVFTATFDFTAHYSRTA